MKHGRRSIAIRVMAVVLLAGIASGGVAIYVAHRAMADTAEVKLVEDTSDATDRARRAIGDRIAVARAQLGTAALLAEVGRIAEVPAAVSDFVVALRVHRDADTLELARTDAVRARLPATAQAPWVDGELAGLRIVRGGTIVLALVDVGGLLPPHAELVDSLDPRLAVAQVIVTRDDTTATATGAIEGGFALRYRVSLAGARAEVDAAMRRALGWTAGITVALVLALAWVLARRVTRPIRALAAAVSRSQGGFTPPPLHDDEIGELGTAIAAMHRAQAVGAEFARDALSLQDTSAVIARLEAALALAHPAHGWRVRLADATGPTGELEVPLVLDGAALGFVVGRGAATEDELRSVAALCNTALAAIKSIGLAHVANVNDKLALLGRVSAGVAHEINNPLAYVVMNLNVLEEELPEGELRQLVRETLGGVDRVAQIVKDLGRLSRGGTQETTTEDLAVLVGDQIKVARSRTHGVALELQAAGPVWTRCLRGRLGQAILNLVVNAIDAAAARRGGRVIVSVSADATHAIVSVRDNGGGIPEAVRRRLFHAFFTTKGEQGTGLGLYLSRQFVQLQGGELEIVESGPTGTEFAIRLPLAAAPGAVPGAVLAESSNPSVRRRVLVVDDEPQIVRTLERWLSSYVDVDTAIGGRAALDLVARHSYALVLCDWNMPDVSGSAVVAAIRADRPRLLDRTVLMSGGAIEEVTGLRVLAKPLDLTTIREMLGV